MQKVITATAWSFVSELGGFRKQQEDNSKTCRRAAGAKSPPLGAPAARSFKDKTMKIIFFSIIAWSLAYWGWTYAFQLLAL